MTEAAVHAEPSADAGATDPSDSEGVVDLGADLEGPTVEPPGESQPSTEESPAPSSAEAAPGSQEQSTIQTPDQLGNDLQALSVDRLPKELQPFGQHILNLHRTKVGQLTERERELERKLEQQQTDLRLRTLEQGQQTSTQEEQDPLADLRATLPPAEQQALDTIGHVAGKIADHKFGGTVQEMSSKVEQLTDVVQKLAMHIVQNAATAAQQNVATLRQQFPDLDNYEAQINALTNVPNPATGRNYTIPEAYGLITGKTAAASQQMRAEDAQVRQAPTTLQPTPAAADAGLEGEPLTEDQLASKLRGLGLEP